MVCVVLLLLLVSQVYCEMTMDDLWMSWKSEFNKQYNSLREESFRRSVWEKKFLMVKKHNEEYAKGQTTFTMGTNQFSDMTSEEIKAQLHCVTVNNFQDQDQNNILTFSDDWTLPSEKDWNTEGYVTKVQDQGTCGSCWAFSAAGALEAQMKKKTGSLVPLSVQNLVDCTFSYENNGCKGGDMTNAFNYVRSNGGIDSADFYKYTQEEGMCHYSPSNRAGNCTGYYSIPRLNETALLHAVAKIGPVSVGINSELDSFHNYKQGIYRDDNCDPFTVTHAVLVVGYGGQRDEEYWLIKNSWGTQWGDKGYMKMTRGRKHCGIPTQGVVPFAD